MASLSLGNAIYAEYPFRKTGEYMPSRRRSSLGHFYFTVLSKQSQDSFYDEITILGSFPIVYTGLVNAIMSLLQIDRL